MRTGFSLCSISNREKPVFITGIPANGNRFFPVRKSTQGKPCFHYMDGFAVYVQVLSYLITSVGRAKDDTFSDPTCIVGLLILTVK